MPTPIQAALMRAFLDTNPTFGEIAAVLGELGLSGSTRWTELYYLSPSRTGLHRRRTKARPNGHAAASNEKKKRKESPAAATGAVLAWVRKHPGCNAMQIRKGMDLPHDSRHALRGVLKSLAKAGHLKKKGQARGTTYACA